VDGDLTEGRVRDMTYRNLSLGEITGELAELVSVLKPGFCTLNAKLDCRTLCHVLYHLALRSERELEQVPG
jgi:hypothetical protein